PQTTPQAPRSSVEEPTISIPLEERPELPIQGRIVSSTERQLPSPRGYQQPRWEGTFIDLLPQTDQFCDDSTAIGSPAPFRPTGRPEWTRSTVRPFAEGPLFTISM